MVAKRPAHITALANSGSTSCGRRRLETDRRLAVDRSHRIEEIGRASRPVSHKYSSSRCPFGRATAKQETAGRLLHRASSRKGKAAKDVHYMALSMRCLSTSHNVLGNARPGRHVCVCMPCIRRGSCPKTSGAMLQSPRFQIRYSIRIRHG